jgi:8-oxo-dGTP pyrophosphatase MutT (NUDIX family)
VPVPPLILNPQSIPIDGVDDQLPLLPAEALTVEGIRRRFAGLGDWRPEFAGDGRIGAARTPAPAAVLVPLIDRTAGLQVLLTRRTDHLRSHAGQISFPGGRAEAADGSAAATALREAEEEIGLPRSQVEVIGEMPAYVTVTSFAVRPVVGLVSKPFRLVLDGFEVAEAFEVPLAFLMNPANHQRRVFSYNGGRRQFLAMPWQARGSDGSVREYFIWGATAAMLRNLYRLLAN